MRVRSDAAPSGAFSLEPIPAKPGHRLARFRENATEFEEVREDGAESGWEYDEYTLTLYDSGTLEDDVEANYDAFLERAKAEEADRNRLPVRDEVLELQEALTESDAAAMELYETTIAMQAQMDESDAAIMEIYESLEG